MEEFINSITNNSAEEDCCMDYQIIFNDYKDEDNNSLLQIAYLNERYFLFEFLLLSNKIDVNNVNINGKTIMNFALESQDYDLMYKLLNLNFNNLEVMYDQNNTLRDIINSLIDMEKIEKDFKHFGKDEINIGRQLGEGAYGEVFLGYHNNGKRFALKRSKDEEFKKNLTFDIFKEIMILKTLNRIFPKSTCKICGTYKDVEGKFFIVTEYVPYTLEKILNILSKFNIDVKKDILMKLFKNLITSVNEINECGFCHFDLKPRNITVTETLEVKLIDMGLTTFIGLERDKITDYLETYQVKAPDDSIQKFCYLKGDKTHFIKLKDYRVDYSSDMFSLGVIIFNAVLGQNPLMMIQLLVLKNYIYYFTRSDQNNVTLFKLSDATKTKIDSFSPYLMDFLMRVSVVDSTLRMTCFEALNHPFITNGILPCTIPILYSITDIEPFDFLETDVYTSSELILNFHELKYSEQILNNYSKCIIGKSEYNPNKELVTEKNLVDYSEYDKYCNYLIIDSIFFNKNRRYLDDDESTIMIELIGAFLKSYIPFEDDKQFFEFKKFIIMSDLSFIPFKSLIIGKTNILRLEGHSSSDISTFYNMSHIWILNFLNSPRKESISIRNLLQVFEQKAFSRPIKKEFEWISKL